MKLILSFLVCTFGLISKPLEINTTARAARIINADTGVVLYDKNGHIPAFPASMTKIATALFAMEEKKLDLSRLVQVSAEAVRHNPGKRTDEVLSYLHESDGTMMGLVKGEVVSLDAVMHGLLMISGNDAANVIAETCSGSITQFIEELNEYVRRLGCKHTHFKNPHGYHHSNHVSTPADLCILFQKALEVPALREIMGKSSYLRPKTNKRPEGEMKQGNWLVSPTKKYFYPKAIAGKTGFYSLAGWCLIAAASDEGRNLIACVMGCSKINDRFEETRHLFDVSFAEKKVERLLVDGHRKFIKVLPGAKSNLTATLGKSLSLRYFPAEESEIKAFISWHQTSLPIRKGAIVGEVRILNLMGEQIAKEDLYATETVSSTFLYFFKEKWNRLFR
jgi:D-alanyl-D-alanine carboxypeptidase (penicillin-binding protein 5/6)